MSRAGLTFGIIAALAIGAACSDAGTETIYVDGSAGSGGSADASAGAGGSAASGGSSGSAGSGGAVDGSAGSGGVGGAAGSGGSGGAGGSAGAGGSGGSGGAGGSGGCGSSPTCKPNEICAEVCGMCGSRARICDANGQWLPWSACSGESGVCTTGEKKSEPCGKCGTRTHYCSTTCDWLPGPCDGEGVCSEGAIQTTNASCAPDQVRVQFCEATCAWGAFSSCSTAHTWQPIAAAPLEGRNDFGYAWTGTDFYVVGGYGTGGLATVKSDGAKYDPVTNAWTPIAKLPTPRYRISLVHTGSELIYWGGSAATQYLNDGARYDIATNTWTVIPGTATGVPSARYGHALAWDQVSNKLIVWGGYGGGTPTYKNDGAIYDSATGVWTALPAAPIDGRYGFAFAWDPLRRWLYVWGGYGLYMAGNASYRNDGAIYDAVANAWTLLPAVPAEVTARYQTPGLVIGDKFVVWGGYGTTPTIYKTDGLVYDAVAKTWTVTPAPPHAARYNHLAVTNGSKAFFFGGYGVGVPTYKADGAVLDPVTLTWTMAPAASIEGRTQLGGAWTPSGIIIWGGYGSGSTTYKNDGARYLP